MKKRFTNAYQALLHNIVKLELIIGISGKVDIHLHHGSSRDFQSLIK